MKIDLEFLLMAWLAENFPDRVFVVGEMNSYYPVKPTRLLYLEDVCLGHITDWGFIPWIAASDVTIEWLAADPNFFDYIKRWLVEAAFPRVVNRELFEPRS